MQGAVVFVQIRGAADLAALHKNLHGVANVKEVYMLAGPTDVLCNVEAADMDSVVNAVMAIRRVEGVASTDTRFILSVH
ncbi:MAG: Lrp/AsnC ligand binding domain-containing protein [Chloroflexi bacterium]|nr:Lrp/AsnC ligand binding domain-containing protein [Chloroflexota bacterium]